MRRRSRLGRAQRRAEPHGRSHARRRTERAPRRGSRVLVWPLAIFAVLALMFAFALQQRRPSRLPSALIGKPAPGHRCLPALEGLSDGDARRRRLRQRRPRHGRSVGRELLGLLVRALRAGASAAGRAEGADRRAHLTASTTRTRRRPRAASSAATAIRSRPWASMPTAAPPSNGASTACRRPSSSTARARSSTSTSARSRPRRWSEDHSGDPRGRRRAEAVSTSR